MARYRRSDKDRQKEPDEESSHKKKGQQPVYDQLKAQDENTSEHSKDTSITDYSPLLIDSHSGEGRASLITELQQSHGNAYMQQLVEHIQAEKGSGQPLEPRVQAEMEAAFGESFDGVVVHTDQEANRISEKLGAAALTSNKDIYFRQNIDPYSEGGKGLLAHELAHVVQQSGTTTISVGNTKKSTELEIEAETARKAIVSRGTKTSHAQTAGKQVRIKQKASSGAVQAFSLIDWIASKAAEIATGGKYNPERIEQGKIMAEGMRLLKEFDSVLSQTDKALSWAEQLARMTEKFKSDADSLAKIRGKIEQVRKGPGVILDTEEKLDKLRDTIKILNKLADKNPTPQELEDPSKRDDFIKTCAGGLKLAAEPLKKLPSPISDFAIFFTEAETIIKGMARGFVMGIPTTKAGREQLEREAGTKIIY